MSESRRDFVLKLAKGAAYSAPVVHSLAAPDGLLGQGQRANSQKGGMGKGMSKATVAPDLELKEFPGTTAPWATTPGRVIGPPGGGGSDSR